MELESARAKLPELIDDPDERIAALAQLVALLLDERDEHQAAVDHSFDVAAAVRQHHR